MALGEVLGEHEIAYAKTGARTITLSSKKFSKQKGHIQGHIVDERTKQPMIGANVTVMGTNFGAATNTEGIYRIENLQEEVYKLKVSYIGYVDFVETDVLVVRGKTTYVNEIELPITYCPAIPQLDSLTAMTGRDHGFE